jgi:hypothetical protein
LPCSRADLLAYFPDANSLANLVPLVDRTIYPADQYPDGQWDYYRYYTTHFEAAVDDLNADQAATLASTFRSGTPDAVGKVSASAMVTRQGGRFGAAHHAPADTTRPGSLAAGRLRRAGTSVQGSRLRSTLCVVQQR